MATAIETRLKKLEAVRAADNRMPVVIVRPIVIPGENGPEVIATYRREGRKLIEVDTGVPRSPEFGQW
ncbi:hypothetical protein [Asticcacaulis sp.]|uniref:hypothetical protein n=1 Tax=Asticcacaulis sp. TaxID=1872648 RepID=UPI0031D91134